MKDVSFIEKLLDGVEVEWKALGEVLIRTKGTNITAGQMKELHKDGAPLKVFAGGKTIAFVDFEDIPAKNINREPSIIVKSRGFIEFEYYEGPFSHKNEMWSYYSKDDGINTKYVYYFLKLNEPHFQNLGGRMQMPQISIPDTDKFKIPIPSLSIQTEIVHILDTFTTHTAELTARKKQYNYYRDQLLTFEDGEVEWKALGEVAEYQQPTKYLVKSKKYNNEFNTPVLTAGKTFILGYTDETDGIYNAQEKPVIIFDDFTTANKWVDFDFKAKSSAMKMITSKDKSDVLLKYVFYWLNTLPSELIYSDHKRQWISNYSKKKIPIPPLNIQTEIVHILDTFTTHTAELTAELTARKKQYNYYRDQLLTFEEGQVEWKTLREIVKIQRGKRLVKSQLETIGNYAVYQNSMTPLGYYHERNVKSDTTFIISAGSAGEIGYSDFDFWAADDVYFFLTPDNIESKFLYYFLLTQKKNISSQVRRASIPRLSKTVVERLQIPIPPLNIQTEIVTILDKFDALTNSISEGLPREIKLRQQQYEYYRDLLLSFPKSETTA